LKVLGHGGWISMTPLDGTGVLMFSNATIQNNSTIGNETASFFSQQQIGPLNSSLSELVDNPYEGARQIYFNVTEGYMGIQNVVKNILLMCVPLNNSAVNLTWVAEAMLADVPGVENYHELGMNQYRINGDTIEWYNDTSSPQDYLNQSYYTNGTFKAAKMYLNQSRLGIGANTMNGSLNRIWNYTSLLNLKNTEFHNEVNDVMYFRQIVYGGAFNYRKITISKKYHAYFPDGDNYNAQTILNATAEQLNYSTWVPLKNNTQPWPEMQGAIANDQKITYLSPFDMICLAYPMRTTGAELIEDWGANWGGLGLTVLTSGLL
jgi:hypothetical protein